MKIPENVYYPPYHDNFYDSLGRGMGNEFWEKWKDKRHLFPSSIDELTTSSPDTGPIPEGVYFNSHLGKFYSTSGKTQGINFWHKWYRRRSEFPTSIEEANRPNSERSYLFKGDTSTVAAYPETGEDLSAAAIKRYLETGDLQQ